ncbi:MAG: metallo-beta-lactamase [uncultured bacterium]|nr:MAG: metallo-beta-lactamase [uncultured bacterium]
MTQVKILVQGYLDNESGGRTCPNVVLIEDGKNKIVVDPGTTKNQKVILDALKKEGLTLKDITYVALTHSHIDHFANIGMFGDKKIIEFFGLWDGGKCLNWPKFTNIKIIKTPGHAYTGLTFLVIIEPSSTSEELGFFHLGGVKKKTIIAICGDVWWKENYSKKDPYASDLIELEKSRKKVLKSADWIIPGHGTIFQVKK